MMSPEKNRKKIRRLNLFRLGFFLFICSFLITSLIVIDGFFIILLTAFIINFSLQPPVNFLTTHLQLSRAKAVPFVFFTMVSLLVSICIWMFPFVSEQFASLRSEFPIYTAKTSEMILSVQKYFESFFSASSFDIHSRLEGFLFEKGRIFFKEIPANLTRATVILFLAPFFSYFMLKSELGLTRNLFFLVPNHVFQMFLGIYYKISKQIGNFVRARLLEAFLVGLIVGTMLTVLDVPYAILLGSFTSLTNLVPYVGPVVGSIPIFLVTLVNDYESQRTLLIMGLYFFTQFIDSMVLIPLLLSRFVNLHPLTIIVIIMAGAQFMGILGMIISIPIANAIKIIVMEVYQYVSDNI